MPVEPQPRSLHVHMETFDRVFRGLPDCVTAPLWTAGPPRDPCLAGRRENPVKRFHMNVKRSSGLPFADTVDRLSMLVGLAGALCAPAHRVVRLL